MSTNWPGSMAVNVVNLTLSSVSQLTVSHTWSGSTTSVGPASLDSGDSTSFSVNCGPGSSDDWSLTFNIGATNYYRTGKQCDIKEWDATSGGAIIINLLPPSTGFSIVMPKSSSCTDNFYDT